MSWDYRVLKKGTEVESSYAIHEVYYDDQGAVTFWSEKPISAFGETLSELRNDILWFWQAFCRPLLVEVQEEGKITLVPDSAEEALNSGHAFEVMDRTSVIMSQFSDFIGSHPLVKQAPELAQKAQIISNRLFDFYQDLANLTFSGSDR